MRTRTFLQLATALCGLGLFTAAGATETGLKIRLLDGRPVVGGVFLEGRGPYTFLLDTGAQSNLVAESVAAKLGWQPAFRVEMASVAGVVWRGGYVAARVDLGSAGAGNQEFLIAPLDEIRRLSGDIDGVLGQEFLGAFDYLLDLRRRRLVFDHPAPVAGTRVPFELSYGRMVVPTSHGRIVLDSGAGVLVLRRAEGIAVQGYGNLSTQAGAAQVRLGTVTLRVGGRAFRDLPVALLPAEQSETDGLLPASLLGSLYVSNSGRYLIVDPDRD